MAKKGKFPWGWTLGATAAALGVGILLSSEQKQEVADDITKIVGWLNNTFGHKWVSVGIAAVTSALPPPLGTLVNVLESVYEAEQLGSAQGWSGAQKHAHAATRRR